MAERAANTIPSGNMPAVPLCGFERLAAISKMAKFKKTTEAIMANQLSNFQFQDNTVRVVSISGEPWFLAADVCKAIGISSPTKAVKILDEDEVALKTFQGLTNGNEEANFISESGMYKIIMCSQNAIKQGTPAHAFIKWVAGEVLPSIRKTGGLTHATATEHTDRTTSKSGFRPVSLAVFFYACSMQTYCPLWAG